MNPFIPASPLWTGRALALAYWQLQAPISPWLTANGGAPTVIFCFVYLYLSFAGAGPWSIDSMIAHSRSRAAP